MKSNDPTKGVMTRSRSSTKVANAHLAVNAIVNEAIKVARF